MVILFLSVNKNDARPQAYYEWLTNGASRVKPVLSNPKLHYRWRYLDQIQGPWKVAPMALIPDTTYIGAPLDSVVDLSDGVGDLEYFFTADVASVFFSCLDFTFNTSLGWGGDGVKTSLLSPTGRRIGRRMDCRRGGPTTSCAYARARATWSGCRWSAR